MSGGPNTQSFGLINHAQRVREVGGVWPWGGHVTEPLSSGEWVSRTDGGGENSPVCLGRVLVKQKNRQRDGGEKTMRGEKPKQRGMGGG